MPKNRADETDSLNREPREQNSGSLFAYFAYFAVKQLFSSLPRLKTFLNRCNTARYSSFHKNHIFFENSFKNLLTI